MACSSFAKLNASSSQWIGQQSFTQHPGSSPSSPPAPTIPGQGAPPPEFVRSGHIDRVIGSDPVVTSVEFQRQLQRLQIGEQDQQAMYRRKNDDNLIGGYTGAGDYYVQKTPENAKKYNGNLIELICQKKGTPLRPGSDLNIYVFALFNENMKPGPSSEKNFGLFKPDGSPAYSIGLSMGNISSGNSNSSSSSGQGQVYPISNGGPSGSSGTPYLSISSTPPEQLTQLYDSMFDKFDIDQSGTVDLEEFREEMKKIMLAIADGLGSSPIQMVLKDDDQNLLKKAADLETAKTSHSISSAGTGAAGL